MQDSVKQRLIRYLAFKGVPHLKFEKTCGMCNGYVKGIRKSIGEDKLRSIALNYPDINRQWLLFGEGEMLNEGYTSFNAVAAGPAATDAEDPDAEVKRLELLVAELQSKVDILLDQVDKKDAQIDRLIKLLEK